MKVKLISHSQAPMYEDSALDLVAYCARVSNPENQNNKLTNKKLVKYLMKHKHWSPLEMVSVCLEVETTRDIARQILRHRSFSFQEFSQRYADPEEELDFTLHQNPRLQDTKNRQNSLEIDDLDVRLEWLQKQSEVMVQVKEALNWARDNDIAKEVRRAVLPEGLTVSRMYMNGTLRSWMHYVDIRSSVETQKEHREVAVACAEALKPVFPLIEKFVHV